MFGYKPKEIVIKPKLLYSHFTYGDTYEIYFAQKPWVDKTFGKTNHKGSRMMWVPTNKIICVANIFSNKFETPFMVPRL